MPTVTESDQETTDHLVTVGASDDRSAEQASGGAGADVDDGAAYQQRLGARLRSIRRSQGLRLQDVEERSEGRFKAVVVGSYERGDRAVSAHKLAGLAAFYGISVAELLPDDAGDRPRRRGGGRPQLSLSVARLRARAGDPELTPLLRLVQHVQWLRDDHDGSVLTLRTEDLRTVAVALGVPLDGLDEWLDGQGLLHR